jgi:uncharacterized protein YbjT (DUF2867 family)
MILVTSAHGTQGRLLLPKLAAAGATVRALRLSPRPQELLELGATDAVIGDASDPAVIRRAMVGVQTVYHVGPSVHPDERAMGMQMIEAALEAGASHFVLSSVLHPILTELIQHELKRDIEERLVSCGLNFTILQPGDFLQSQVRPSVFARSEFRYAYSLDRRQAVIDVEDLTDVAAKVLLEGEPHFGATYELSAENVTAHDIAERASRVVGRPVRATQIPREAFVEGFVRVATGRGGDTSYEARVLEAVCAWYDAHDFIGNPNVLTMLLGRAPATVEDVLRRVYARAKGPPFSLADPASVPRDPGEPG